MVERAERDGGLRGAGDVAAVEHEDRGVAVAFVNTPEQKLALGRTFDAGDISLRLLVFVSVRNCGFALSGMIMSSNSA